jgi:hypothetical protein
MTGASTGSLHLRNAQRGEASILDDPAVQQPNLPLAALRDFGIMSDQYQGRGVRGLVFEQVIDHETPGAGVQISGWLVGEQQLRPGDESPGDRDALLFASRQLPGIMAQAMAEADSGQTFGRSRESVASAIELKRDRDVFESGHRRDQMEGLEYDADPSSAQPGERILSERSEVVAVNPHKPGARPLQPSEHHHQGRLS